ncbi:hypothetical protein [Streptomyces sp. NPDC050264]|uniref:hypothetical protein n=1 Tax=Streptomyces sp. NPDC050264 TaxID=3155038 RepID=UPI00343FDC0E
MQAEVLSGLIGFGGALVGGVASFGGVWFTLTHQRKLTQEARLLEIGLVAADKALNELIALGDFLGSVRGDVATLHTDERAPYLDTMFDHMRNVERAVARIPSRELRDRVKSLFVVMRQFRAAGVRHFFAVGWLTELTDELTELLAAYIRSDPLPPFSERTKEKRRRAAEYEQNQRRRYELFQDRDPANVDPREENAMDEEPPAS